MIRALRLKHRQWAWLLPLLGGTALALAMGARAKPFKPGELPAAPPTLPAPAAGADAR